MEYIYNEKTGTLHINGFCMHAKSGKTAYKIFKTYNDALAYDGNSVRMCKICEKKKEQMK